MTNRRETLSRIARWLGLGGLVVAGFTPAASGAEPWTEKELIEPANLAKRIEAGTAPLIICVTFPVLYRAKHIRGAKYAGPGNKAEGTKDLTALVQTLPRDTELVVYCGCCPMKDCPNIRPAYQTVKQLGFRAIRVLNIPTNMHDDWTTKGYSTEA